MIASEDNAMSLADGYPTGGFEGLGCFINEERAEFHAYEQTVGRACEGAGDDFGVTEEGLVDGILQVGGSVLEASNLLMTALAAAALGSIDVADGFAHSPKLSI